MAGEPATAADVFLLTFPPMIDSEACRFALNHYGVPYRENAHIFGWASIVAFRHGLRFRIPLLCGDGYRLAGPWRIVSHFDRHCPPERRLLPSDKRIAEQVAADWHQLQLDAGISRRRVSPIITCCRTAS
jgi:hypothetical protein